MLTFLHLVLISHESGNGESKFCAVVIFVHLITNDVSLYRLKYLWGASPSDCSADSHVANRNLLDSVDDLKAPSSAINK
jgi:hypothetical protein